MPLYAFRARDSDWFRITSAEVQSGITVAIKMMIPRLETEFRKSIFRALDRAIVPERE